MRIEILPPKYPKDDATPTIDLCCRCSKAFAEGEPLPEELFEQYPLGTLTGSTDVCHRSFKVRKS